MPVGSNFPALVFAIGSALIFLFATPALWSVLVAAIAVGAAIRAEQIRGPVFLASEALAGLISDRAA